MPNGRLFQLEIVAGKRVPITICLEVFEFEAVILPCTGVAWGEDVLRFNRRESVNNFVKKELDVGMTTYELRLATDCPHNNGVFRTMIFF